MEGGTFSSGHRLAGCPRGGVPDLQGNQEHAPRPAAGEPAVVADREVVCGAGPLLVSNLGLPELRASYRNAAIGWWCLVVLVFLIAVGMEVAALF
jgi:hypothetical protein